MRTTLCAIGLALAVLPAAPEAQIRASAGIQIDLPVVLPQLVVITPGVQVVPDFDREVFFTDGYYWVRHDNGWYRSRSHRGGWALVPVRTVPAKLVRLPPGHYKRWKPAKAERRYDGDRREHHDREHHEREHHDRYDDRRGGDDHGRGHDDRGRGRGHDGKHKGKHGKD